MSSAGQKVKDILTVICLKGRLSLLTALCLVTTLSGGIVQAQSITPSADGTGTQVIPNGNSINITVVAYLEMARISFTVFRNLG